MNVLITNIGRRGYLVDYIKQITLFKGKVYVSDCDITASGLYGKADEHFLLPKPSDDIEKYVSVLIELCRRKEISIVIPVIDPEIYLLSEYVELFKKNGILLLVSSKNVLDICYNKILMNDFLVRNHFYLPKSYTDLKSAETALKNNEIKYPLIVKPVYGSGSVSTSFVNSLEELRSSYKEGLFIQEVIIGTEYGIDVFNDLSKNPVRCVIKKKISMRSGETDKAVSVKNQKLLNDTMKLAFNLGHIGNLDIDAIISEDNKIYFLDLNPRFGGGYPITHEVGVNLVELVIKLFNQEKITPLFNNYEENIMVMKTISTVKTRYQ